MGLEGDITEGREGKIEGWGDGQMDEQRSREGGREEEMEKEGMVVEGLSIK